jgi:hypothetical protein
MARRTPRQPASRHATPVSATPSGATGTSGSPMRAPTPTAAGAPASRGLLSIKLAQPSQRAAGGLVGRPAAITFKVGAGATPRDDVATDAATKLAVPAGAATLPGEPAAGFGAAAAGAAPGFLLVDYMDVDDVVASPAETPAPHELAGGPAAAAAVTPPRLSDASIGPGAGSNGATAPAATAAVNAALGLPDASSCDAGVGELDSGSGFQPVVLGKRVRVDDDDASARYGGGGDMATQLLRAGSGARLAGASPGLPAANARVDGEREGANNVERGTDAGQLPPPSKRARIDGDSVGTPAGVANGVAAESGTAQHE